MLKRLRSLFKLPVVQPFPPGMAVDNAALFGLLAFLNNMNAYAEQFVSVAGTTTTTLVLTAANVLAKNIVMTTGSITGGFTINLPSTVSIFAAMGPTIPQDGSFWFPLYINNRGTGQTGTLTAGDASTTVNATENTVATNVAGKWMVNVAPAGVAGTLNIVRSFTGST